jgi:hypothetical protein
MASSVMSSFDEDDDDGGGCRATANSCGVASAVTTCSGGYFWSSAD